LNSILNLVKIKYFKVCVGCGRRILGLYIKFNVSPLSQHSQNLPQIWKPKIFVVLQLCLQGRHCSGRVHHLLRVTASSVCLRVTASCTASASLSRRHCLLCVTSWVSPPPLCHWLGVTASSTSLHLKVQIFLIFYLDF